MSLPRVISLADTLAAINEHWKPRIVERYNGNELRVSKVQGDFPWHSHDETDELFLVLEGELNIDFRDGTQTLRAGEFIVVPRGVEHRTRAAEECHMLFIDREGEPNTGSTVTEMTLPKLEEM